MDSILFKMHNNTSRGPTQLKQIFTSFIPPRNSLLWAHLYIISQSQITTPNSTQTNLKYLNHSLHIPAHLPTTNPTSTNSSFSSLAASHNPFPHNIPLTPYFTFSIQSISNIPFHNYLKMLLHFSPPTHTDLCSSPSLLP